MSRSPRDSERGDGPDLAEAITRLGERSYTWPELCREAGVEHEVGDRLWRALGFPDMPPDAPGFTAEDVRALQIAAEGLERLSGTEREAAIELMVSEARGVSGHLARIVEIQVDALAELQRLGLRRQAIQQALSRGIEHSDLGWLIFYGLRRRLDAALRRRAKGGASGRESVAVGFVDLAGFTETAGRLPEDELGRMLARFESLVWDVVTEAGGQIVKLIGDEAMMICPSPERAAEAALDIVEATRERQLPTARAGLAVGSLLARAGDYFGGAVNLAARLVERAEPGVVVVDERLRGALGERFTTEPMGEPFLKGIGHASGWKLVPSCGSRASEA